MILDPIIAHKKKEVAAAKSRITVGEMERRARAGPAVRPFAARLEQCGAVSIIAELKKASPSAGLICPDFDALSIAREYEANGAAALSVLTDQKFFQGSSSYLSEARAATRLPVLRKDFIIDPYQVSEARAIGADCILLIVRLLSFKELVSLKEQSDALGMDVLVETHNADEIEKALDAGASLMGINNRNLDTLEVDLGVTRALRPLIPDGITVVSESGIRAPEDIRELRDMNVHAALVGESLMRSGNRGALLASLARA